MGGWVGGWYYYLGIDVGWPDQVRIAAVLGGEELGDHHTYDPLSSSSSSSISSSSSSSSSFLRRRGGGESLSSSVSSSFSFFLLLYSYEGNQGLQRPYHIPFHRTLVKGLRVTHGKELFGWVGGWVGKWVGGSLIGGDMIG